MHGGEVNNEDVMADSHADLSTHTRFAVLFSLLCSSLFKTFFLMYGYVKE